MEQKNLIAIKQLRSGELTSYILNVINTSGIPVFTGIRFPINSGVSQLSCSYSAANPIVSATLGNSGSSEPFLALLESHYSTTGSIFSLSDSTDSSNYYLNLLVRV
jgi:hypothetical protein